MAPPTTLLPSTALPQPHSLLHASHSRTQCPTIPAVASTPLAKTPLLQTVTLLLPSVTPQLPTVAPSLPTVTPPQPVVSPLPSSVNASLLTTPPSSVPPSLSSIPQQQSETTTLPSVACVPPSKCQSAPPALPQAPSRGTSVCPQPHHEQEQLCLTRPSYRQGRHLKAVKVYTVNDESVYLLVARVPALHLQRELCKLCSRYGRLVLFTLQPEYPTPPFTETWLAKYASVKQARFAKRLLDGKNFFGGLLHVCYAPELEDVQETRSKLQERRRAYLAALSEDVASSSTTVADRGGTAALYSNLWQGGHGGTGSESTAAVIGPQYPRNAFRSSSSSVGDDGGGSGAEQQRSLLCQYHPDDKLAATLRKVTGCAISDDRSTNWRREIGVHQEGSIEARQYSETDIRSEGANNSVHNPDVSSQTSLNSGWAPSNKWTPSSTTAQPVDEHCSDSNWHQRSYPSTSTSKGGHLNTGGRDEIDSELPGGPPRLGSTYASMSGDYEPDIGLVNGEQYKPVPLQDYKSSAHGKLNSKKISSKRKLSKSSTPQPIFNLQQQNKRLKKRKTIATNASSTSHTTSWETNGSAAAGTQSAYGHVKAAISRQEGAGQEQLLRLQRVLAQALPLAAAQRPVRQGPDRHQPGKITLADGVTLL